MYWLVLLAAFSAAQLGSGAMISAETSTPTVVRFELGSKDNQMKFFPEAIRLRKGNSYKLIIRNASPVMHEFDAPQLSKYLRSEKVEVKDAKGQFLAEIHGTAPREIEVAPGATVEWRFVTLRAAGKLTVVCDLPGHRAAGMVGIIWIE